MYQNHVPCSFAYRLVRVDDKFTKPIVVFRGENAAYEFIKAILKEFEYCKKVMKKHFNKNLIMSEEEEQFQSSNICWICEKLIDDGNDKVSGHCHIIGKFRGAAHWSCNIRKFRAPKEKVLILMNTWTVLKKLLKKNYLIKNVFTALKRWNN